MICAWVYNAGMLRSHLKKLVFLSLYLYLGQLWAQPNLDIQVTPANKPLKDNIAAYIGKLDDLDADGLQRYRASAQRQARQALEALGYYQGQISVSVGEGKKPRLQILVQPGEPVRLRRVDIRVIGPAGELPAFARLDLEQLRPGAILHHGAYEDIKSYLQQNALRYGFFAATFVQQNLRIDPQELAADIELHFSSGPRYLLGAVEFTEDSYIRHELLQRLVPFRPGTPYDSALLARLGQNLQATGYFEDIRVDAVGEPGGEMQIPVQVSLRPVKKRTYGVGLGYSTDIGARARFTWEQHRINQRGHKLGFENEWSRPQQSASGWYSIPLHNPLTDQLRLVSGYKRERYVDANSSRYTHAVQWHKRIKADWQRVLSVRKNDERFDYGYMQPRQRSEYLLPGIGFSKLRADAPLDPQRGYRLQLDVEAAKKDLLADADLLHVSALVRGLITVADNHRFLGRNQIGMMATSNYSRVPPSMRFFAGGDQSVRGYGYQSLSPRDEYGNRVGGRYMLAQSAEYQYSLNAKWRLAAFVDRGKAVDKFNEALKVGAGVGVRWVSPIGPLRLDWAQALHDEREWRIHFSMGPEL